MSDRASLLTLIAADLDDLSAWLGLLTIDAPRAACCYSRLAPAIMVHGPPHLVRLVSLRAARPGTAARSGTHIAELAQTWTVALSRHLRPTDHYCAGVIALLHPDHPAYRPTPYYPPFDRPAP